MTSDSMVQPQMDLDRFRNVSNLDLVELNRIRDSIHGCIRLLSVTVTVTVTKVFILRFLLKDRKCITESFTYIQRSPG